jgi:DNA-binding LacI/PurR family transcriptional regulator
MRNADLLSPVLLGAEAVAREHGYALFIGNTDRDPHIAEELLKNLAERRVDGILCPPVMPLDAMRAFARRSRIPVVVYGRTAPIDDLPHTILRFARATEEALDHLIGLGHRSIGTVAHTSEGRLTAEFGWSATFIREALRARGLATNRAHHLVMDSAEECTRAVHALVRGDKAPTALVVTNLFLVPGTLAGLKAAGVQAPSDLSLIGCGDSDWARFVEPPLSVVAADLSIHLADTTRVLINLIEGEPGAPVTTEHHARYIRRSSVGPAPGGDTPVQPWPAARQSSEPRA